MNEVEIGRAIEPHQWFVSFHRTSRSRVLSLLAFGELKHVSAFGYCPGVKMWLLYDVCWSGTRVVLMDQHAIKEWTKDCDVLKIDRTYERMALSGRWGFYCVPAVKHLIGLRCVAMTPTQLYRHILRTGGIPIHGRVRGPAAPASS